MPQGTFNPDGAALLSPVTSELGGIIRGAHMGAMMGLKLPPAPPRPNNNTGLHNAADAIEECVRLLAEINPTLALAVETGMLAAAKELRRRAKEQRPKPASGRDK